MPDLKSKRFLIFGTGAVGGYYGGMLARAGYNVTFVARGKNYEVLKEKGLTLIRNDERENFPINVVEAIHELPKGKIFDYIIICVKTMDTKSTAEAIKPIVCRGAINRAPTTVVSLQNGVENEDIIAEIIGKEHVMGALVFVASKLVEPGVVYQFGYNGGLIGELDCKKTKRVQEFSDIFQGSGIDIKISKDIRGDIWNKLVWNAAFNPLSVVTGKTVDKLLKENYDDVKNIMTEVRDVALAHGYNIRKDTVEFNLERSKGFTDFKTSMLQDYERGRPLETDAILGVVIKKAKEKNISVPTVEKIYNKLII